MDGIDQSRLEADLVADLLAHVDRRSDEFDRRLAALEGGFGVDAQRAGRAKARSRAEADSLYRDIRRLSAAMALTQTYMSVRREQLAQMRRTELLKSTPTMTEEP